MDEAERDWRHLSKVKTAALERLCERILADIARISSDEGKSQHQRYLDVFRRVRDGDDDIAIAFNDLRRSAARMKIREMRRLQLFTDEEFAGFSPGCRASVDEMLVLHSRRGAS